MDLNQIVYQIYPLGMLDAPYRNDGVTEHRILKIISWIPHMKKLGITAVYFCPVFQSETHGYDTSDYAMIDCRLGTNEDFAQVCDTLHDNSIQIILDGVFNHTGRSFYAFRDVLKNRESSRYRDWFYIDFNNHSAKDGFSYDCWEGHRSLVRLNLDHPDVRRYLFSRIDQWVAEFDIDGIRLDTAHILSRDFIHALSDHLKSRDPGFYLLGESTAGDYRDLVSEGMLDSVTNYEHLNPMIDAFNEHHLTWITDSLNRQFGWGSVYAGMRLLSFGDNHDSNRLASRIKDPDHLKLVYDLLFAMPGLPCIYYGSEWGCTGKRTAFSDRPLRPAFAKPKWNSLCGHITALSEARKYYRVMNDGDFVLLHASDDVLAFRRRNAQGQLTFMMNISGRKAHVSFDAGVTHGIDLIRKSAYRFDGECTLDPKSSMMIYSSWE